jgi:polyhydroxyalkanoate synthesis regulator phasin
MSKRAKFLMGSLAAVLVAVALVGWVLAQGSSEETTTTATTPQTFLSKVAANLGIEEERLIEAITQARSQMLDEAVEQGRITQEQADRMKQQIEGRQAMLRMIDEAVEEGRITQEQAGWMKQQIGGRRAMGRGLQDFGGRWGFRGGPYGWGWNAPPSSP